MLCGLSARPCLELICKNLQNRSYQVDARVAPARPWADQRRRRLRGGGSPRRPLAKKAADGEVRQKGNASAGITGRSVRGRALPRTASGRLAPLFAVVWPGATVSGCPLSALRARIVRAGHGRRSWARGVIAGRARSPSVPGAVRSGRRRGACAILASGPHSLTAAAGGTAGAERSLRRQAPRRRDDDNDPPRGGAILAPRLRD